MSRVTGRHTRPKKLTPKQNVHIFREEQVDSVTDIDAIRNQVDTGVEKAEESVSPNCTRSPAHLIRCCVDVLIFWSGIPSTAGDQSVASTKTG